MSTTITPNIETKIAARSKSVFASFGQIVSDFYLEAGIYFVGGFNAALVAWDLYTTLTAENQPQLYAIAIAVIAFIAVEGLAVYLVGAAAKTNNWRLWFFSVIFASFFTYAHYQEMTGRGGVIAEYITLAIPFFVVVGYWARTVKIDAENDTLRAAQDRDNEAARLRTIEEEDRQARTNEAERQRKIEDEDRQRQQRIEEEDRQLKRQLTIAKMDKNHEIELANIEVRKDKNIGQNGDNLAKNEPKLTNANEAKKDKIAYRRDTILTIMAGEKLTQAELANRLGVSLGTVKSDLKALNGSLINSKELV